MKERAGHVVHIQETIRAYRVFVEMPQRKGSMQSLCFFSGCGIITRSFPFSLWWLSDVEVLLLVDAPPPWRKSPTRAITSSLLNFMWLIGLELLFLQLSTYRMYALMIETSKAQKNNFLHHFSVLRRKQYVAQYWSAVSTPPMFFM